MRTDTYFTREEVRTNLLAAPSIPVCPKQTNQQSNPTNDDLFLFVRRQRFLLIVCTILQIFPTMAPTYTLYSPAGSFRAFAPLIAAEYNGIDVDVVTEGIEAAVASMSPTGKAPLLKTPQGVIFSSHAMARFVAGIRRDTGLLGNSLQEQAAVDAWMDWTAQDVELPSCVWFYPVAGYMPWNEEA